MEAKELKKIIKEIHDAPHDRIVSMAKTFGFDIKWEKKKKGNVKDIPSETKLRTLKEMPKHWRSKDNYVIEVNLLKAEAVKWVKHILKLEDACFNDYKHERSEHNYGAMRFYHGQKRILIDFFNLTEEDLE